MSLHRVDQHRPTFSAQLLDCTHSVEQHKVEVGILALLVDQADLDVFCAGSQVGVADPAQGHDCIDTVGQRPQSADASRATAVTVDPPVSGSVLGPSDFETQARAALLRFDKHVASVESSGSSVGLSTGSIATAGSTAVAGSIATVASAAVAGSIATVASIAVAGSIATTASMAVAGSIATVGSGGIAGSSLTALSLRCASAWRVSPALRAAAAWAVWAAPGAETASGASGATTARDCATPSDCATCTPRFTTFDGGCSLPIPDFQTAMHPALVAIGLSRLLVGPFV